VARFLVVLVLVIVLDSFLPSAEKTDYEDENEDEDDKTPR